MAGTKKKGSKSKARGQPKQNGPKGPEKLFLEQQQLLPPQERMATVRPLWESLSPQERETLLTVPLDQLRAYAKQQAALSRAATEADVAEALASGQLVLTLEPELDEVLETGITRSRQHGTWKVWQWPREDAEFRDSEAFRKHLEDEVLGDELRAVLPRDPEGSRPVERAPEAALRQRMQDLLTKVQEQRATQEEAAMARRPSVLGRRQDPVAASRDANIELINTILTALESEHESLNLHCVLPVTAFVCDVLPESARKSTRSELHPEDLESLLPDDVVRIIDFLTEKVDALSSKLKPEAKDLEKEDPDEEPIGDVDLFSLIPDGAALCVNDKWLGHLRSRVLGEDGQPRQAAEGEDPTAAGLVLEWVYGTIVSTAEKARDAAHRSAGSQPPSAEAAVEALVGALEDQALWEQHARSSRDLLSQMLASRKEFDSLGERYDLRTKVTEGNDKAATAVVGGGEAEAEELPELPADVILFMLKREALLTAAKVHALKLEQVASKRDLKAHAAELRHGEPRFERLKRDLEEVKSAPSRSVDGTFRTAAEERHRALMADAAIEEQISVQTAFRKTGARLQKVLESKQEIEVGLVRREQEIKQLNSWRHNVCAMIDNLEDLLAACKPLSAVGPDGEVDEEAGAVDEAQRALVAAVRSATRHAEDLESLKNNFHSSIRKQLYVPNDDRTIFDAVKRQLKEVERRLEEGRAAVQHLENFAINVACDDPGIAISGKVVMPFLQEKLDALGLEWAAKKAAEAEDEVIRMELDQEDKQRQEKEKKARAKLKAKEKAAREKEKERADREARERNATEAKEEARRRAASEEEEAKRKRAEEVEAMRRAEEELMERRRKELLSDEGSYWQQRAQQEEMLAAQAEAEQEMVRQAMTEQHEQPKEEPSTAAADGDGEGFIQAGVKKPTAGRRGGKPERKEEGARAPRRERDQREGKGAAKEPRQTGPRQQQQQTRAQQPAAETAEKPAAVPNGVAAAPAAASTAAPPAPPSPEKADIAAQQSAHPPALPQAQPAQQQMTQPLPPSQQQQQQQYPASPPRPGPGGLMMPLGPPLPGVRMAMPPGPPPRGMVPVPMPLPPGMVPLPLPPGAVPLPPHAMPAAVVVPAEAARSASAGSAASGGEDGAPQGSAQPQAAHQPASAPQILPLGAMPPHGMPPPPFVGPPPPRGVYPGPPGGVPPPPGHLMYFPPPPVIDSSGRLIRPPGGPFVLPNGVHMGALPPGVIPVHMQMPGMHGGPRPRPGGGPGMGSRLGSAGSSGGNGNLRQLRAAAQPFVPNVAAQPFVPSTQRSTPPVIVQQQRKGREDDRAAAPTKAAAEAKSDKPASPRGILEPATLSAAAVGEPTADEAASSSSKACSSEAEESSGATPASQGEEAAAAAVAASIAQQPHAVVPAAATAPPTPPVANGHAAAAPQPQRQALQRQRGDLRKLKAVRGLTNAPGLYNCFVNVIIQCLWHLTPFRAATLSQPEADLARRPVLSSVWGIFQELRAAEEEGEMGESRPPASPRELRQVLSGVSSKAAVRFELGDMHDASEVLGELYDRLHREEAGTNAEDPTLPRKVAVPAAAQLLRSASSGSKAAAGGSPPASVWGDAAALRKVKRAPAAASRGRSLVQRMFGIEVQASSKKGSGDSTSSSNAAIEETLQFTKYFHLIPAQGLRQAAPAATTFEAALVSAAGGPAPERLVSRPAVFTLSLVWEAPMVPPPALEATVAALRCEFNASELFHEGLHDEAKRYRLRCMMCYSSSHYFAFALNEEVGQWLLLDDTEVSAVGGWSEVQSLTVGRRLQPSLLFYEAIASSDE